MFNYLISSRWQAFDKEKWLLCIAFKNPSSLLKCRVKMDPFQEDGGREPVSSVIKVSKRNSPKDLKAPSSNELDEAAAPSPICETPSGKCNNCRYSPTARHLAFSPNQHGTSKRAFAGQRHLAEPDRPWCLAGCLAASIFAS